MCNECFVLNELFKAADSKPHGNYTPTLAFIKKLVDQGRLEFVAGDCHIEEVDEVLDKEMHYTVCHYFKCKNCNQYFFIGACIRGTPIYKTMKDLSNENLNNMLWGRCGTIYEHNSKK
jgi:Icc-related predicted phosphoesterase